MEKNRAKEENTKEISKEYSAYEEKRVANIRKNAQVLELLGLNSAAKDLAKTQTSKRKRKILDDNKAPDSPRAKLPRSCRRDSIRDEPMFRIQADPFKYELPDYVKAAFEADNKLVTSPFHKWSSCRHHQHLSISLSGYSVATTGCAGYGVALAQFLSPKLLKMCVWKVECVKLGVGGSAIGLAKQSWKGPYKSLGTTENFVLGAYHASGNFLSGRCEYPYGPPYGPGDIIGITIGPNSGTVEFSLNGVSLGPVPVKVSKKTDYLLACQPYMGGIIRIIH